MRNKLFTFELNMDFSGPNKIAKEYCNGPEYSVASISRVRNRRLFYKNTKSYLLSLIWNLYGFKTYSIIGVNPYKEEGEWEFIGLVKGKLLPNDLYKYLHFNNGVWIVRKFTKTKEI